MILTKKLCILMKEKGRLFTAKFSLSSVSMIIDSECQIRSISMGGVYSSWYWVLNHPINNWCCIHMIFGIIFFCFLRKIMEEKG